MQHLLSRDCGGLGSDGLGEACPFEHRKISLQNFWLGFGHCSKKESPKHRDEIEYPRHGDVSAKPKFAEGV